MRHHSALIAEEFVAIAARVFPSAIVPVSFPEYEANTGCAMGGGGTQKTAVMRFEHVGLACCLSLDSQEIGHVRSKSEIARLSGKLSGKQGTKSRGKRTELRLRVFTLAKMRKNSNIYSSEGVKPVNKSHTSQ